MYLPMAIKPSKKREFPMQRTPKSRIETARISLHEKFVAAGLDWMYNRHAVAPGADADDAPRDIRQAGACADDALANGVDRMEVLEWLSEAIAILKSAQ